MNWIVIKFFLKWIRNMIIIMLVMSFEDITAHAPASVIFYSSHMTDIVFLDIAIDFDFIWILSPKYWLQY